MTRLSKYKWSLLILVLQLAAVIWFARALPADAQVPLHWNIHNQIDGWSGKTFGLLWGLGLNLILFLMIFLMPWYSPWYRQYRDRNEGVLPALTAVLVLFFALISVYSLAIARWGDLKGVNVLMLLMGLLFVFIGNLLPKVPKNFFVGYKTPWTLANETVWDKTHRLGGILFVISGLILILKGFILLGNSGFQVVSAAFAFGLALYPVLHSFILFKRLDKD